MRRYRHKKATRGRLRQSDSFAHFLKCCFEQTCGNSFLCRKPARTTTSRFPCPNTDFEAAVTCFTHRSTLWPWKWKWNKHGLLGQFHELSGWHSAHLRGPMCTSPIDHAQHAIYFCVQLWCPPSPHTWVSKAAAIPDGCNFFHGEFTVWFFLTSQARLRNDFTMAVPYAALDVGHPFRANLHLLCNFQLPNPDTYWDSD